MRDSGPLEWAAMRPATTLMGADAYPSIQLKAAALMRSLVCNHALVDGNKRLQCHAMVVSRVLDGNEPDFTQEEAFELIMALASGEVRDVDAIAPRFKVSAR